MSLQYTKYGLIYNTDGSLCLTAKPSVLFTDLGTFQIERQTSNLVTPTNFTTTGRTTVIFPSLPPVNQSYGSFVESGDHELFRFSAQEIVLSQNQSVSVSGYFFCPVDYGKFYQYVTVDDSEFLLDVKDVVYGWTYLSWTFTNTNSSDVTVSAVYIKNGDPSDWGQSNNACYGLNYQVELQPFQTSFTQTDRPTGVQVIPSATLPPEAQIAFWFKPNVRPMDIGENMTLLQNWNPAENKNAVTIFLDQSTDKFIAEIFDNDGTTTLYETAVSYGDYNHCVLVYSTIAKTVTVYLNGTNLGTVTNVIFGQNDLYVGNNVYKTAPAESVFTNFIVGYLKDQSSTPIWTDQYVFDVYHGQKPHLSRLVAQINYKLSQKPFITRVDLADQQITQRRLQEKRRISLDNDVLGAQYFDGVEDIVIDQTLKDVVDAGTYTKVTVDTKGRVTLGTTLVPEDIPELDVTKMTTGVFPVERGGTGRDSIDQNKLIVGNGTDQVISPTELHWDNENKRLGINTDQPEDSVHIEGNQIINGNITARKDQQIGTSTANTVSIITNDVSRIFVTSDGLIGIGTTDPTETLTVNGNIAVSATADAFIGTTGDYALSLQTNGVSRLHITNGGNVGIGTTTPSTELQVVGDIGLSGADRYIGTLDDYALGLKTNSSTRLHITNDGKVGIGTTQPESLLETAGEIAINPLSGDSILKFKASGTDIAQVYTASTDGSLRLNTSGTDRITVLDTGNVGIGITQPTALLHVNGTSTLEDQVTVNGQTNINNTLSVSGDTDFVSNVNISGNLAVSGVGPHYVSNGNVGIGTETPAEKLTVVGNAQISGNVLFTGAQREIGTADDYQLSVITNGTSRIVVTADGKVGINRTPQNYQLEVDGQTQISADSTTAFVVQDTGGVAVLATDSTSKQVGVNTLTPQYTLDVNGIARIQTLEAGSTDDVVTHSSGVLQTRSIDSRVWGTSLVDYSGTTANYIPQMSDEDTITNSEIYQNATQIGIGTTDPTEKLTVNGNVSAQVLKSTATSTQPFVVSSSTKVDNLNADKLDGYDSSDFLIRSGGTMTGYITLHADPTEQLHAATKRYVDSIKQGLDIKDSVRVATTENLDAVYDNVDKTLTANQNEQLIIDGVSLQIDDRVLVKNQTNAQENGIYVVTEVGSGSTPWVLTRQADADQSEKITAGMFTFVTEGDVNSDSGWVLTTNDPITLDTTQLTFVQFSGAGQIIPGFGITKDGNIVSVQNPIRPAVDSTTAFRVQQSDGSQVFNIDTTNGRIGVLTEAPTEQLDVNGDVKADGFISTIQTGTPPFTVSSTTVVTNLNADLLDGKHAADLADAVHTHTISEITDIDTASVDHANSAGNADTLDNYHANTAVVSNTIPVRDANGDLPGNILGNAATATKLETARTISLTGDVSGSTSFDGSGNVVITATVANDSHTHDTRYYTETEVDTLLAGKSDTGHTHTKADITDFAHNHTISEISDIGNASVDYANSAGNADKLDNLHASDFVQNAGNVPSIQQDAEQNIPTAGTSGRLYVQTDTNLIYRDTGTEWVAISGGGGGASSWDELEDKPRVSLALPLGAIAYWQNDLEDVVSGITPEGYEKITTLEGKLYINNSSDASLTNDGGLTIGNKEGLNITIDGNEILARDNGANATLYLNVEGGDVVIWNTTSANNASPLKIGSEQYKVWHEGNDGSGSGLDADKLDGQDGSYYRNQSNLNQGTVPTSRLSGTYDISISGNQATQTKLQTQRTISLSGDVSGSQSFDGSQNVAITQTVANNSHTHTISNITDIGNASVSYASSAGNADKLDGLHASSFLRSDTSDTMSSDLTVSGKLHVNSGIEFSDTSQYILYTQTNWGIYWDTSTNEFKFRGSGTDRFKVDLDNGNQTFTGTVTQPTFSGTLSGNASTQSKLQTQRTISLSGDVSGSQSFDGSQNITITQTVQNDSHTHDGRYYTESEQNSRFVNVTGDTITGQLSLTYSSSYALNINTTYDGKILLQGSSSPYIRFRESATDKQYIQWSSGGYLYLRNQEDGSGLRIKDQIDFTKDGNTFYTVWHAGNDGSGSGLDADKLDGYHASSFVKTSDYEDADVLAKIKNVDGSGSGLDADTLDGYHATDLMSSTEDAVAGYYVEVFIENGPMTGSRTAEKMFQAKVARSGTYRIRFTMRQDGGGSLDDFYIQVRKNDSTVTTYHTTSTKTCDTTVTCQAGDLLQLYGYVEDGTGTLSDIFVLVDNPVIAAPYYSYC